jgi:hypothetical protein
VEDLRRLLLQKDGMNYKDDTIIQVALEREIERVKKE